METMEIMEKLDKLENLIREVHKIVAEEQLFVQIRNETSMEDSDREKISESLQNILEHFVASKPHFSEIVCTYNKIRNYVFE